MCSVNALCDTSKYIYEGDSSESLENTFDKLQAPRPIKKL